MDVARERGTNLPLVSRVDTHRSRVSSALPSGIRPCGANAFERANRRVEFSRRRPHGAALRLGIPAAIQASVRSAVYRRVDCPFGPNRYQRLMDDGPPGEHPLHGRRVASCPRSSTSSVSAVASPEKRSRLAFRQRADAGGCRAGAGRGRVPVLGLCTFEDLASVRRNVERGRSRASPRRLTRGMGG